MIIRLCLSLAVLYLAVAGYPYLDSGLAALVGYEMAAVPLVLWFAFLVGIGWLIWGGR